MSKPVVAIVGRPNVGKSTLFNKLAGSRVSIVEDIPGVTRDRIYFEVEWNGRAILLVDTGGIEPRSDDPILKQMKTQAEVAVETADVIVFMVDVNVGLTAADRDIATMLKKSGKPVIPVVNKVDSIGELPMEYYEFYELGFDEDPIPLIQSARNRLGRPARQGSRNLPRGRGKGRRLRHNQGRGHRQAERRKELDHQQDSRRGPPHRLERPRNHARRGRHKARQRVRQIRLHRHRGNTTSVEGRGPHREVLGSPREDGC